MSRLADYFKQFEARKDCNFKVVNLSRSNIIEFFPILRIGLNRELVEKIVVLPNEAN